MKFYVQEDISQQADFLIKAIILNIAFAFSSCALIKRSSEIISFLVIYLESIISFDRVSVFFN